MLVGWRLVAVAQSSLLVGLVQNWSPQLLVHLVVGRLGDDTLVDQRGVLLDQSRVALGHVLLLTKAVVDQLRLLVRHSAAAGRVARLPSRLTPAAISVEHVRNQFPISLVL